MRTLLHVSASPRSLGEEGTAHRSISRRLGEAFSNAWTQRGAGKLIRRDLAATELPFISNDWIAGAFTPPAEQTEAMRQALGLSDILIDEVRVADVILISTPMYNYGMPAVLKAWFDQVVRINQTFSFDLARGDWPIRPLMAGKLGVLLSSSGEFGFDPGQRREPMNFLSPHVKLASAYLGVEDFHEVRSEFQEFGDARHRRSFADALKRAAQLGASL